MLLAWVQILMSKNDLIDKSSFSVPGGKVQAADGSSPDREGKPDGQKLVSGVGQLH